jgi:hypothetical protein
MGEPQLPREGRIPVVTLLLGSVFGLSARQSRIAAACESASELDHALFVGLGCRCADDAVQEQSREDGHHQYRQSQVTLVKMQNLILLMLLAPRRCTWSDRHVRTRCATSTSRGCEDGDFAPWQTDPLPWKWLLRLAKAPVPQGQFERNFFATAGSGIGPARSLNLVCGSSLPLTDPTDQALTGPTDQEIQCDDSGWRGGKRGGKRVRFTRAMRW